MNNSRFTPGPWVVHPYRDVSIGEHNWAIDVGPRGEMVARVLGAFKQPTAGETAEANARLIAAAPTLYAALRGIESLAGRLSCDNGVWSPSGHSEGAVWLGKAMEEIAAALALVDGEEVPA